MRPQAMVLERGRDEGPGDVAPAAAGSRADATEQQPHPPAAAAAQPDAHALAGPLERAIKAAVIPRLVQARRPAEPAGRPLSADVQVADLQAFVGRLLEGDEAGVQAVVHRLRRQGLSVESLYLELLAPAACALGSLWDHDLCDFPGVTVGVGRLQRMLRELSPDFDGELSWAVPGPRQGRRVLLAQPPHEQHSLGLSMVAAFFRRDGWLVEGGVGTSALDPAQRAQAEWLDVVGFSSGSHTRLAWLREKIAAVRLVSRNPDVVVLVGGPLFVVQPEWVRLVGADGCAADARRVPRLAAELVAARHGRP